MLNYDSMILNFPPLAAEKMAVPSIHPQARRETAQVLALEANSDPCKAMIEVGSREKVQETSGSPRTGQILPDKKPGMSILCG